jgi:prepilin-type N-terminal cleavage/methylation domain-containing protein
MQGRSPGPSCHNRQFAPRTCRPGLTLLEMVVVLALVATAMAVSWPAMQKLSTRQNLAQAAETARIRLLSARIHAIDQGMPYQFRFEPGGSRFCILPGDSATEPPLPSGGGTIRLPIAAGKLPGKVQFDPLQIGTTGGGMILEARFSGLPDARDLAIINWSPPIIFEADGSSDDQTIQLSDPNSDTIYSLTLRGLTGGVLVTRDSSTNAAK